MTPSGALDSGRGIRSFVVIPLLVDKVLVGTLNLGKKLSDAFSKEHIAIAKEINSSSGAEKRAVASLVWKNISTGENLLSGEAVKTTEDGEAKIQISFSCRAAAARQGAMLRLID